MPALRYLSSIGSAFGLAFIFVTPSALAAVARKPVDLVGTWDLTLDRAGADRGNAACRIMLRPQQSDRGEYFMGIPTACRHAMPVVAAAGRWKMPDSDHVVFDDPSGAVVLSFAASGGGFTASLAEGTYRLKLVTKTEPSETERSVAFDRVDERPAQGFAVVQPISKRSKPDSGERVSPSDLAGRYAVLRDKRDTGCMITLDDSARVKGGDRAQLAPGCRDQGIVIFDPSAWVLVKGELVLTARAGHKTVLEKQGEGLWAKDAKDGGKPLGLKKL